VTPTADEENAYGTWATNWLASGYDVVLVDFQFAAVRHAV
jgi:hypothetical protein